MKKILLSLFLLLCTLDAEAATRYSRSNGVGTDCTEGSPCSQATMIAGALANDTLVWLDSMPAPTTLPASGTGGSYTTFRNHCPTEITGATVVITGAFPAFYSSSNTYIKILGCLNGTNQVLKLNNNGASAEGIIVGGSDTSGSHHIWIENTEITGALNFGVSLYRNANQQSGYNTLINNKIHTNGATNFDHGVYIESHHNTLLRNKVYNNACYGFHQYNGYGEEADYNEYGFNEVYENGVAADPATCFQAIISRGNHGSFHNNVLRDGTANNTGGLDISRNTGGGYYFYNNTIFNNSGAGGLVISSTSAASTVRNHILSNNNSNFVISGSGTHAKSKNLCTTSGGTTNCDLTAASAGINTNGTLQAGSAAIDQGVSSIGSLPPPLNGSFTARGNGALPDLGAFETIPFASGSCTTTSICDFQFGTAYAPLSTVSGCANVTVRQAGATKTCATFANNPNGAAGVYRWTCAACLTAGGGDIDVAISAGKFTDTINVGGTLAQPNFAVPTTIVANNITGATEVFTVRHVRQRTVGRAVTDTIAAAWLKAEDAVGTVRSDAGKFSFFNSIDCTIANCPSVGFQYEWNKNGGAWAALTDSCLTNDACYDSTNSAAPHGTVIPTSQLTDALGNYLAGAVAAQASSYPVLDLAINQSTQIQVNAAIKTGLVAGTDQICVRPKLDSGAAIVHVQTFCVNVVSPAGSPA